MRLRRAVLQIPPKSSVPPGLPVYKIRPALTHSESTLPQLLIPLHFNSPRINTYKKPGRVSPSNRRSFANSSLPHLAIVPARSDRRFRSCRKESLCLLASLLARVRINVFPKGLRFLCFHTLAHSFALRNSSTLFASITSALFRQNTRVGGTRFQRCFNLVLPSAPYPGATNA